MEKIQYLFETWYWLLPLILILAIWETIWKLIAMWKAARNNHLAWFICLAFINTIGILPIIYILIQREESERKTHSGVQPPPH